MAAATIPKTSWADDVDELDQPKIEDYVDENGLRVTTEYAINDEGKKVKITRKIKRTLQKSVVEHTVAERKKWAKFGKERGNKEGPDRATTTVGENVALKISAGNKTSEPEVTPEQNIKTELAKAGAGKVICRLCKGDHFTAKCPYKDSLAGLETADLPPADDAADAPAPAASGATGGKYVPPSMRGGASRPGESMGRPGGSREDLPTLRVTNISEDTQETDLRELFGTFGRVARVYVGRDRETGIGKGFAFVSFDERAIAQRAMEKLNGKGYDNLILSVQWSQPRPDGR
ncbi:eukaryotic translation initiation factor 3 subunit G-domain-containing protein [Suillus clintonianus]|uniref:eukaryotic translation initiation factor 3 subunit G-domain-containing protein n=1 Tax=Suillus clintonianus TaxID=1904413 RepID=UPI001B867577|nr:eukaryotic translation initiation factor 3 subunit G-domain-containing protein [Suillus clintonianus]KAG2139758.1 eukaryotic translation initiation factor 3 subunit G-domain-containing protein [Suillus clintonianus]